MLKYTIKRILQTIVVLWGVTLVAFVLLNVVPGDPARLILGKNDTPQAVERLRHEMGLDRPLIVQYGDFLGNAVQGDLGESYFKKIPVTKIINQRFLVTLKLAASSFIFAMAIGILLGIISARSRGKLRDSMFMLIALLGISAPSFWVAIILQIVFGIRLDWLPISGIDTYIHYILPAIALGIRYMGSIARITRTSMLDVMGQDYIRTARAKGVSEKLVIYKHTLKNALIPIITMAGLQLGYILTGSMLVETVFSIPGMGKLIIEAINTRDMPLIQGTVMYVALICVITNLIVDISYAFVDPKIRVAKGE